MAHGLRDRPRILIFEENQDCGQIILSHISRRLRQSSVNLCFRPDQVIAAATSSSFDVAVVDFPAKTSDGLDVIDSLRKSDADLAIAAIIENVTEDLIRRLFTLDCQELLVKDSSFYRVVPQLIDSLYRRRQKQVRETSIAPSTGIRLAPSAQRIIRDLCREINAPLANILDVSDTLLEHPTRSDFELQNRIRNIRNAAQRIKDSLEAFASKAIPRKDSPGVEAGRSRKLLELKSDR